MSLLCKNIFFDFSSRRTFAMRPKYVQLVRSAHFSIFYIYSMIFSITRRLSITGVPDEDEDRSKLCTELFLKEPSCCWWSLSYPKHKTRPKLPTWKMLLRRLFNWLDFGCRFHPSKKNDSISLGNEIKITLSHLKSLYLLLSSIIIAVFSYDY